MYTCARRTSSWSITLRRLRYIGSEAVITRELVAISGSMIMPSCEPDSPLSLVSPEPNELLPRPPALSVPEEPPDALKLAGSGGTAIWLEALLPIPEPPLPPRPPLFWLKLFCGLLDELFELLDALLPVLWPIMPRRVLANSRASALRKARM